MEATYVPNCWSGLHDLEPVLRGFLVRRCRDESELDDAVQETLLRAARFRGALQDPGRLRGWALRIARNVLHDHGRREGRMPRTDLEDGDIDALQGAREFERDREGATLRLGEAVVERDVALDQLSRAVRRMGPRERALLHSYYGGGLDGVATSRECAVPHELVKVHLFRARRRLRRELNDALGLAAAAVAGEPST